MLSYLTTIVKYRPEQRGGNLEEVRPPRPLLISLLFCSPVLAQETVEISEPATVSLASLFAQADVVAVVQVVSGDSESYEAVVYKSKVLTVFKGAQQGQYLFFGLTWATRWAANTSCFFDGPMLARR